MITIKPAGKDDVQTLQILNDEIFVVGNQKYDPDLKIDWAKSDVGKKYFTEAITNPNDIFLIAWDEKKAIGYLAASPKDFGHRLSKYIEIDNLGVSPDYRSKGIGSQLMNEFFKVAKQRGFQKVYVNTYFDNLGSIKFYEKNGFRKIDISLEKTI
jgi:ribosomal protein S18 acetylase RimI-like enzyme